MPQSSVKSEMIFSGYSISNWYGRSKANYLKLFKNEYIVWGLVAVVSLGFLTFASMRWFRRKAYEVGDWRSLNSIN